MYKDYLLKNFPEDDDFSRMDIMRKFNDSVFWIIDPFDWTSNYGKPIYKNTKLSKQYKSMFEATLQCMLTTGFLPTFKPQKILKINSHRRSITPKPTNIKQS